jgi:hypothetical protein
MAWRSFATGEPAVVKLLLPEGNPAADSLKQRAAALPLEWFDPQAIVPTRPSYVEDPEPVRLLRKALLSGEMAVRIKAGDELAELLTPTTAWQLPEAK